MIPSSGRMRMAMHKTMIAPFLTHHQLQPCCSFFLSTTPTPSSAIANLKSSNQCLYSTASQRQPSSKRLFSTGTNDREPDRSHERPHMYQLEHIQKRLEFTVPLMFQMRLDYTFYRKDVILEDQIIGTTKSGLQELMDHMGFLAIFGRIRYAHVEAQALNINPILEDGTVRLRWRVIYIPWLQALNPMNYKEGRKKEIQKWFDGYSVFHVDGDGLVYKWTLQKTMPDDSALSELKDKTKKLVKNVVMPNAANCQPGHAVRFTPPTRKHVEETMDEYDEERKGLKLRQMRG